MIKMIGCIILLLGTVGVGLNQSYLYDKTTLDLCQAAKMLEYLISQIEKENATLPECICRVSCRMEGQVGELLQSVTERLDFGP